MKRTWKAARLPASVHPLAGASHCSSRARWSYDSVTCYIVATYLAASACNFAVSLLIGGILELGIQGTVLLGLAVVFAGVLAYLVSRRIVWPLAGVAIVGLAIQACSSRTNDQSNSLDPSTVTLLHSVVLLAVVLWASLRMTGYYRRSARAQGVVTVLVLGACLSVLPSGLQNAVSNLRRALMRGPVNHMVGMEIGTLHFQTPTGRVVSLDDPAKLYVLNFISSSCAPCIEELPELATLQAEFEQCGSAEVVIILRREAQADSSRLPSAVAASRFVLDNENWAERLGIVAYPTKVLVRGGRVAEVIVGRKKDSLALLRARAVGDLPSDRSRLDLE